MGDGCKITSLAKLSSYERGKHADVLLFIMLVSLRDERRVSTAAEVFVHFN